MITRNIIFSLLILFLVSCSTGISIDQIRLQNRQNLNKISLGDSKQKVMEIMGTESYNYHEVSNPYKTEILTENGKTYEVIFYYTDKKKSDNVIKDDKLTPFVFYKRKVIGYGWLFFKNNIQRYKLDVRY